MKGLGTAIALLLAVAPVATRAEPGDDWGVTRDPFDKNVVARYKAILARQPHDASALAKLLAMYRRYRTVDALVDEYRRQLDRAPNDWATHVVLGRLLHSRGEDVDARKLWTTAVAIRSDDTQTWIAIGELDRAAGKNAEAKAAFDHALAHARTNVAKKTVLRSLANVALAIGDSDGANAYFRQYLEIDPKNAQLWIERGDAMLAAGKHSVAVDSYRAAEKLLGGDPARRIEVATRLGQVFEGMGEDDRAVAEYRRAIDLAPKGYFLEVEVTDRIIDIFRKKQALPALIAQYEKQWPTSARRHFEWQTLGKLYEETGDHDQAIAALRRAVAASAGELDTQRRLIALLENSGRDGEALAQYEAVVRAAPGQQRFHLELAERYWRRGNEKKALASLRRLEQRFPNDPGVLASIASLYQVFGKDDLAIAQYERLVRIEPNEPDHLVSLGEQYFQRGDRVRALAIWTRIAASKTPRALAKLGQVLSDHGTAYYAEAEKNFAAAVAAEPNNVDFRKGLAALYDARKEHRKSLEQWDAVMRLLGTKSADRAARRDSRRRLVTALGKLPIEELKRTRRWEAELKTADLAKRQFSDDAIEAAYYLVDYFGRPGKARSGEPLATLQKLVAMVPDDVDIALDLVKAYRVARKFEASVALALKVAAAVPSREREMFKLVSEIKAETRRDDEAIEWQKKALAKSPNDPAAYASLGDRYAALQKFPEAVTAYEQALKLDPRNSKTAIALVSLYVQTGIPAKANHVLRNVLRNETDEDAIARAGEQAIDLAELTDTLGELEQVVSPLSFVMAHKPVYRRILVALYLRYVPTLVERSRRGSDDDKAAARVELERIGARGLRPLLEALRDDKDVAQQREAVRVLGYLGNRSAARPLVRLARRQLALDSHRIGTIAEALDREVRVDALVAAGRLGDRSVVADVIPLVHHDELAIREAATFALGRSADRRAVAPLIKLLADRQPSLRALACLGLAQISDPRVGRALVPIVANATQHGQAPGDEDAVRAACAYAIGARRIAAGRPALLAAIEDNRGESRRLAAWALGQLGDAGAMDALLHAYFARAGDSMDEVVWAIGRVAGHIPVPAPLPVPADYPKKGGQFDLTRAISELVGPLPAPPPIAALAVNHHQAIAAAIVSALSEHRDVVVAVLSDLNRAPDRLALGALTPPSDDGRATAALAAIASAIEAAVKAQTSAEDPKVRALAVMALAKMNRGDAVVAQAISDASPQVRATAMRAASILAGHRSATPGPLVAALVTALRSPAWEDRRMAALSLGELGTAGNVKALVDAAGDGSSFVRQAVAVALGTVGGASSLATLRTLSTDEVPQVRDAANRSLARRAR